MQGSKYRTTFEISCSNSQEKKNKYITEVIETNKCEYIYKFSSHAGCPKYIAEEPSDLYFTLPVR